MDHESAEHRTWRAARERAERWRADYAVQLGRMLAALRVGLGDHAQGVVAVELAHKNARIYADEVEKLRAGWDAEDAQIIEPPFVAEKGPTVRGAVPGAPSDHFARRAPYNPHA